jgi:hypothetical protein
LFEASLKLDGICLMWFCPASIFVSGKSPFFVALKKQELGIEAESQPKVGAIELPKSDLRPKQELRHTSSAKLSSPCSVDLVDFYNFTGFYCKLRHEAVPATFREALE